MNNQNNMPNVTKSPNFQNSQVASQSNIRANEIAKSKMEIERKRKQFEVISKTNPMRDDYHVGIRSVNDIKRFEEAMDDEESFYYGDFSREDAKKSLKSGKVMVHSSKPFALGGFVSTSKNMAKDYAGGGNVYSQEFSLDDIAWINGDEGQLTNLGGKK